MSSRSPRLRDHPPDLNDPRRRMVVYPLINFVTIAACAVVAGADDLVSIAARGRQGRDWPPRTLDPSSGIPSRDRSDATFAAPDPAEFEECPPGWITSLHEITSGQVVAIDGEAPRGGFGKASGESAIPMVSAWATASRIGLGQVMVDAKSNEIAAIPEPLGLPGIPGGIVTVDAMGCRAAIAEAIIAGGADYVLAVEDDRPTLRAGIEAYPLDQMEDDFARAEMGRHETEEPGHGRVEHRAYYVCDAPADLPDGGRWEGLKRVGVAIRDTVRGGKPADEVHDCIPSERMGARSFGAAVRGHRGIEDRLHWQPDVTFGEDRCRTRRGRADANSSILRRTALGLLKDETTAKVGMKDKRLTAGRNDHYLGRVPFGT